MRPLYRSNVAEVTRLAELAMPHFAECRYRPGISAMIWGANASNAAAKLLRDEPAAAMLLDTPAYRRRIHLYREAGERGADAATMLAMIASREAEAAARPRLRDLCRR